MRVSVSHHVMRPHYVCRARKRRPRAPRRSCSLRKRFVSLCESRVSVRHRWVCIVDPCACRPCLSHIQLSLAYLKQGGGLNVSPCQRNHACAPVGFGGPETRAGDGAHHRSTREPIQGTAGSARALASPDARLYCVLVSLFMSSVCLGLCVFGCVRVCVTSEFVCSFFLETTLSSSAPLGRR